MQIKNYWVGDRPGGSWVFQVLNQRTGTPESLSGYTSVRVVMLGSNNEEIDIPAANVAVSNAASGIVTFLWPSESLFTKPGRYLLQLEFSSANATRRTTVQEILIRELGGVTK